MFAERSLHACRGLVTEGTAGSTGVSLAMLARARGCRCALSREMGACAQTDTHTQQQPVCNCVASDLQLTAPDMPGERPLGMPSKVQVDPTALCWRRCRIAMPDDAAAEKAQLLEAYGAEVQRVRPVSFAHPGHFVHVAERAAAAEPGAVRLPCSGLGLCRSCTPWLCLLAHRGPCLPRALAPPARTHCIGACPAGPTSHRRLSAAPRWQAEGMPCSCLQVFADQFENPANSAAHAATARELWRQAGRGVDAFVCGAGTGGTIAGVSAWLRKHGEQRQGASRTELCRPAAAWTPSFAAAWLACPPSRAGMRPASQRDAHNSG